MDDVQQTASEGSEAVLFPLRHAAAGAGRHMRGLASVAAAAATVAPAVRAAVGPAHVARIAGKRCVAEIVAIGGLGAGVGSSLRR